MSEALCKCGHPHVYPDGSGSCSAFLCSCQVFVPVDEEEDAPENDN